MKKLIAATACIALLYSCDSTKSTTEKAPKVVKPANPQDYGNSITAADLKEDLYIYASDEFEGRETGKPGQKKAVEFLKSHYQKLGVASALPNNNYFQEVPLQVINTPEVAMNVNGKSFNYFDDFISLAASNSEIVNANEIMFVGYGIDTGKLF